MLPLKLPSSLWSSVKIVVTIILSFLISYSSSDRNQCKRGYSFEKVMLALQWPPGVCFKSVQKTCIVNTDQFLIHGSWPTNTSSNTSPEFCCNEKFDLNDIRHLEVQLTVSLTPGVFSHRCFTQQVMLLGRCNVSVLTNQEMHQIIRPKIKAFDDPDSPLDFSSLFCI